MGPSTLFLRSPVGVVARINRPSIMVYGGTSESAIPHPAATCRFTRFACSLPVRAGCTRGGVGGPSAPRRRVDIVSAFEAYGEYLAGRLSDAERADVIETACPGPGACEGALVARGRRAGREEQAPPRDRPPSFAAAGGGMYTANTMACAIEALGMSLPYSSSSPVGMEQLKQLCRLFGMSLPTHTTSFPAGGLGRQGARVRHGGRRGYAALAGARPPPQGYHDPRRIW